MATVNQLEPASFSPPCAEHPLLCRWRGGSWTFPRCSRRLAPRRRAVASAARAAWEAPRRRQQPRSAAATPCPSHHSLARRPPAAGSDPATTAAGVLACMRLHDRSMLCTTQTICPTKAAGCELVAAAGHAHCRLAGGAMVRWVAAAHRAGKARRHGQFQSFISAAPSPPCSGTARQSHDQHEQRCVRTHVD